REGRQGRQMTDGFGEDWGRVLEEGLAHLRHLLLSGQELTDDDDVLIEQMADLCVPVGMTEVADSFLAGLVARHRQRGWDFLADYLLTKQVEVALAAGKLSVAESHLASLSARARPVTGEAFAAWERRAAWAVGHVEPALFFSRYYHVAGRLLAMKGDYPQAAALLACGLKPARPPASSLTRRAEVPLRLALAGVLLEQGQLDECAKLLGDEDRLQEQVGWRVRRLELRGQRHSLRGEYGQALDCFARVVA